MNATRRARIESSIRQELATLVSREIKDPRVGMMTVTKVVVSPDASSAQVFFLPFGDSNPPKSKIDEMINGLKSAQGLMRRHLSHTLKIRHIPELHFHYDRGLENTTRVYELLKEIDAKDSEIAKQTKRD